MKRFPPTAFLALTLPVIVAIFWFVRTSRAATETPDYKIVRTDGKFEIRDYPELTVVTTPMAESRTDREFGRLFRFISGGNEDAAKIAMTAPVLISTSADSRTMSFILPRQTVENGVPKPVGGEVTLGRVEAARFAVLRFDGSQTPENERGAIEKIAAWLAAQKLSGMGKPVFAYYDPPWTPTFLRRNEIMIQIEPGNE